MPGKARRDQVADYIAGSSCQKDRIPATGTAKRRQIIRQYGVRAVQAINLLDEEIGPG